MEHYVPLSKYVLFIMWTFTHIMILYPISASHANHVPLVILMRSKPHLTRSNIKHRNHILQEHIAENVRP